MEIEKRIKVLESQVSALKKFNSLEQVLNVDIKIGSRVKAFNKDRTGVVTGIVTDITPGHVKEYEISNTFWSDAVVILKNYYNSKIESDGE